VIPDLCSPVEEVAPRLLGSVIRHGPVAVRLTELEAYDGAPIPPRMPTAAAPRVTP